MKRSEAIELLDAYNKHLVEEGYADSDLWCEEPTAIDGFMMSKRGKELIPFKDGMPWAAVELPFCEIKERCSHWTKDKYHHPSYKCYLKDKCPAYQRDNQ